jgi:hypothetical protein
VADRIGRFGRHAEVPGQTVARTGRDDSERHLAKCQSRRHLVNRSISTPCHHEPRPPRHGRPGELARVPGALADEYFRRIAVAVDNRRSQLRARARRIGTDAARNRIDDDRDGGQKPALLESQTPEAGVSAGVVDGVAPDIAEILELHDLGRNPGDQVA